MASWDGQHDAGIPLSFRKRHLRSLLLLAVVAASLLAFIGAIYGTIRSEQAARAQWTRSMETYVAIRRVGRAALDAETGQRGYIITAEQRYLTPYLDGSKRLLPASARVERLIGDKGTARQHELLRRIRYLANRKLAQMNRSVGLVARQRIAEARAEARTDFGKQTMDATRANLAELEEIERVAQRHAGERSLEQERRLIPLLFALAAVLIGAIVLGAMQVFRTARIESAAAQAEMLAQARDRAELLAQELNHRVKNMFAIILSIVRMTSARESDAKVAGEKITERIHALTMAHEITQGQNAAGFVLLRDLVAAALAPHRGSDMQCTIDGPDVRIAPEQVQSFGLIFHELATNCAKYGACAQAGGRLEVRWTAAEDGASWLELLWKEAGISTPSADVPDGFGSQLLRASARQVGGTFGRTFCEGGMTAKLVARL